MITNRAADWASGVFLGAALGQLAFGFYWVALLNLIMSVAILEFVRRTT